MADKLSNLN